MTSIFSTLLARACDPKNKELMFNSGYAGFLHDIGLAVVNFHKDEFSPQLTSAEKIELHKHPAKGAEILSYAANVSDKVALAVLQHHEAYDGSGYPRGLRKDQISLPARIVHLCERFTTMLNVNPAGPKTISPLMVLQALAKDPKIDPQLLNVFIKLLNL